MVLKLVYFLVVTMNWTWIKSVYKASEIFGIHKQNVFKMAKGHRDNSTLVWLSELPQKTRDRGSITFKANNDIEQKYTKLKKEVLVDVLEFVRNRNRNMRGMCTVRGTEVISPPWEGVCTPCA